MLCVCGPGAALTLMRPPACVLCAVCVRQAPGLVVDTPVLVLFCVVFDFVVCVSLSCFFVFVEFCVWG